MLPLFSIMTLWLRHRYLYLFFFHLKSFLKHTIDMKKLSFIFFTLNADNLLNNDIRKKRILFIKNTTICQSFIKIKWVVDFRKDLVFFIFCCILYTILEVLFSWISWFFYEWRHTVWRHTFFFLEWRHTVTLHILVVKISISFFLFYCDGMLSLVVLWLCDLDNGSKLLSWKLMG